MSTLTKELANLLSENGFGVVGENIYASEDVPPKPDSMVIIRNTGTIAVDGPNVLLQLESPSIQIVVRAGRGEGQECEGKAFDIKNFLERIASYTIEDSRFVYINHMSGPVDIGVDETMRPRYSTNFYALRTPVARLYSGLRQETVSLAYLDVHPAVLIESEITQCNYEESVLRKGISVSSAIEQDNWASTSLSSTVRIYGSTLQRTLVLSTVTLEALMKIWIRQIDFCWKCLAETYSVSTEYRDEDVWAQIVEVSLLTKFTECEDFPPLLISHIKASPSQEFSTRASFFQTEEAHGISNQASFCASRINGTIFLESSTLTYSLVSARLFVSLSKLVSGITQEGFASSAMSIVINLETDSLMIQRTLVEAYVKIEIEFIRAIVFNESKAYGTIPSSSYLSGVASQGLSAAATF